MVFGVVMYVDGSTAEADEHFLLILLEDEKPTTAPNDFSLTVKARVKHARVKRARQSVAAAI